MTPVSDDALPREKGECKGERGPKSYLQGTSALESSEESGHEHYQTRLHFLETPSAKRKGGLILDLTILKRRVSRHIIGRESTLW